jgi:hypothetical protein
MLSFDECMGGENCDSHAHCHPPSAALIDRAMRWLPFAESGAR